MPVIYERFDGVTYYMQRIMNEMYSDTPKEGTCSIAEQPTSIEFIQKNKLTSPNSVKAALPALIDKDLVTTDKGKYMLCDKFLELWICEEECL